MFFLTVGHLPREVFLKLPSLCYYVTLRKEKIAKGKKCEIKECKSTKCFWKCKIKDYNPSIFLEMEKKRKKKTNKKWRFYQKKWENLPLLMLILVSTNYK